MEELTKEAEAKLQMLRYTNGKHVGLWKRETLERSRDIKYKKNKKIKTTQQKSFISLDNIFTLSGRVGRVGRRKACWGGFRGRHYL